MANCLQPNFFLCGIHNQNTMKLTQRVIDSGLYVIAFVLLLFIMKPRVMFKPNGKPREHGLGLDQEGYKKTLYTVHFVIFVGVFFIMAIKRPNKSNLPAQVNM